MNEGFSSKNCYFIPFLMFYALKHHESQSISMVKNYNNQIKYSQNNNKSICDKLNFLATLFSFN